MGKMTPNILWIMTDEQRMDSLGCYGSPWGRSPNVDSIAARGVRFTSCTTQSAVCVPANAALFTGRYAHACNGLLASLSTALPGEVPLTRLFKDSGYQMANIGKCDYPDVASLGFDVYDSGPGYGASAATPNSLAAPYNPSDYDVVAVPNHDFAPQSSVTAGLIVGGRYPLPKEEAEPGLVARRCEDFFARQARPPFFVRVSIIAPHSPVLACSPFYGMTDPSAIDLPVGTEAEMRTKPQFEQHNLGRLWCFHKLSSDQLTKARTSYYDLCIQVDDAIGMILGSLRRHGLDDNTIIVLNCDHGTLLGEHGLGEKRNFYDPVVQVPLIISWPGHLPDGRVVTDPVELFDLLPTILSLIGLEAPPNVQGCDLAPQMLGESSVPDRPTFCEVDSSNAKDYGACTSHRAMVRHGRWKMSCSLYDAGYGEDGDLYDLDNDPQELHNLFGHPDYQAVVADLRNTIAAWQSTGDG